MKHVFYILVFLQIIYETVKVFGCRKLHRGTEAMESMDKAARKWYLWANPYLGIALILDVIGMATLVMGLCTDQWYLFFLVLLLSCCRFQKLGAWAICLDSILTIVIYIYAFMNAYNL